MSMSMDNHTFTIVKEAMAVIDELGFVDVVSKYGRQRKRVYVFG